MCAFRGPTGVGLEDDPNANTGFHRMRRKLQEFEKFISDQNANQHDESVDQTKITLHMPSILVDDYDNDSIRTWESVSDDKDTLSTPTMLPGRPLGLSRRSGYTSYDDYDVVTVHGICDDHQTAWTATQDGSNWIQERLFNGLAVRQLDYAYDTSKSARIYDQVVDGIDMEATALLNSLALNRLDLPTTEISRPIIWICHDLGGSIVKKALINAIQSQPDSDSQDDSERSCHIRNMYRRLPLLTSAIIFLACPHDTESTEELEDQLFTLMSLQGFPMKTKTFQRVANLSRQIHKINLEFLETKILDRAVVMNITVGPVRPGQSDVARPPQMEQHRTEHNEATKRTSERTSERTSDLSTTPFRLFSMHERCKHQNFGLYYMLSLKTMDHVELVRGFDPSEPDWVTTFAGKFNVTQGFNLKTNYAYLALQNTMLALSPPTRLNEYRFYTEGYNRPALMSWIIEHPVLQRQIHQKKGSRTVYLHCGSRGRQDMIDIILVSQQLYVAYDFVKNTEHPLAPDQGCFYFEFDKYDNGRAGMKAMIVSFISIYLSRFCYDGSTYPAWLARYLNNEMTWSLKVLIILFLKLQSAPGMSALTIILGRIDHCAEEERSIFLKEILKHQNCCDSHFDLVITTAEPDDLICGILPPNNVVSLEDYPLSIDDQIAYPYKFGTTQDRMQRLLARRPEYAYNSPQLSQIFGEFRKVPSLQEMVLEWLANHRTCSSTDEFTDIIREVSSHAHQRLLQWAINQLPVEKQRIVTHLYNWIKYAPEPLTLETLAQAVTYSLPQEVAQLQPIQNHEEFSRLLEHTLGGIIWRDGRDLRFSDEVFYRVSATGDSDLEQTQACRSHAEMATACLRYLLGAQGQDMLASLSVEKQGMVDDLSWSPMTLPRHSLVSYALRFWTVHYQAAGDFRPVDLATEIFQDTLKRRTWTEAVYVISNPFTRMQREYISPLPYMARYGLDDLVRRYIENEGRQDDHNQDYWLAVAEAARSGHQETVDLLLETADPDIIGLAEALDWALRYGEGGALDCLLSKAQQLEEFPWPPFVLNRAVVAGCEKLVSALVQAGYDLNEEDSTGSLRAVHSAVEFGRNNILKILLDSGRIDLELQNKNWENPLMQATRTGSPESIQLLLDAGARVGDDEEILAILLSNTIDVGYHKNLEMLIDAKVYSINVLTGPNDYDSPIPLPLSVAAGRGYSQCTRLLLDNGADPSIVPQDGSALYRAIFYGPFVDICRMLLEKGAKPNACVSLVDNTWEPTLIRAVDTGNKILVEMLLDHDDARNITDAIHPHYGTPLLCAIERGHYDIMELLLQRGADPNLTPVENPDSYSPLFSAAHLRRDSRFIETLIKNGADILWKRNDGWSIFHAAYDSVDTLSMLMKKAKERNIYAAQNCEYNVVKLAAANKEIRTIKFLLSNYMTHLEATSEDEFQEGPLHIACKKGHGDVVKVLLEAGADINAQTTDGTFPLGLLLASDMSNVEFEATVKLMLQKSPNLGLIDNERNTVLHNVTSDTPVSVVMRLVEEGVPVNAFNDHGFSPLARAVNCGNISVARYLITVKGVQADVYHPTFGSILHMAVANSTVEVVRQLIRTGAEPSAVDPGFGEPVLYSAMGNENKKDRQEIIRYLVKEVGIDVNDTNRRGVSPLLRMILQNYQGNSLLKYLLRHGARTDHVDSLGRTATHWAVICQRIDTLSMLIGYGGADVSVADNYGRTPLHFAASKHIAEIMLLILEKCSFSNVNEADVDGWTPLMWACRGSDHVLALRLVKEYNADICVRSKDSEWSPLKIARFHDLDDELLEALVPVMDPRGTEQSWVSKDRETMPGVRHLQKCDGCDVICVGPTRYCQLCDVCLCFKCIQHSGKMHDPDHTFVDLDKFEREQAGHDGDDYQSEDEDESGNRSEDEEEEEDESESEEEEDDDSE